MTEILNTLEEIFLSSSAKVKTAMTERASTTLCNVPVLLQCTS